ncbi:DUF4288 domain-containing protein [Nonomuraea dietziae]|uniref:DUF4288 domain-containing protein n=1 Tax=Nonomuraea dietziae TaxID=65515 RepID=UPI0033D741BE
MDRETKTPHVAILVYVTHAEGGYARPRYSEDVVLIYGTSLEDARATADAMGHEEETSYKNQYGEAVNWKFVGVADVRATLYDTLEENTSLYSRSFYDLARYREVFSIPSLGGTDVS